MEKRNNNRISVLYAIGSLLVILGHSHSSDWTTFEGTILEQIIRFVYLFHMPLFYWVAGYLFIKSNGFDTSGYAKWVKDKPFIKLLLGER